MMTFTFTEGVWFWSCDVDKHYKATLRSTIAMILAIPLGYR